MDNSNANVSGIPPSLRGDSLEPQAINNPALNTVSNFVENKPISKNFYSIKWALLLGVSAIVIFGLVGFAGWTISKIQQEHSNSVSSSSPSDYAVMNMSLAGLAQSGQLQLDQSNQLVINGQLRVNNATILTPTSQPTSPVAGEFYFDNKTDQPYYYNGSEYVSLSGSGQVVSSIGGVNGIVSLGPGLEISNGQLTTIPSTLNGSNSSQLIVTSLQGQTGNVELVAGTGIGISGSTIENNGVTSIEGLSGAITTGSGLKVTNNVLSSSVNITSASSDLLVSSDGNGDFTLTDTNSGSTGTVSLGPPSAQADSSTNSSIFINKTGSGDLLEFQVNGTDQFVVNQSGKIVDGSLSFANLTNVPSIVNSIGGFNGAIGVGQGLTISGSILSSTGVDSLTGTSSNQVIVSGGSGNYTLSLPQDIAVTSTPTFANLTLTTPLQISSGGTGANTAPNALSNLGAAASGANSDITSLTGLTSINPGSALTIGSTSQALTLQSSTAEMIDVASGFSTILNFTSPTSNQTITLPNSSGIVCLQNSSSCGFLTSGQASGSFIDNSLTLQTSANFNIDGEGIAGSLEASSLDTSTSGVLSLGATHATGINLDQNTTVASNESLTAKGASVFSDQTNGAQVFQIQNATSQDILSVNSTTLRVAIDQTSASYPLDVVGDINSSTGLRVAGNLVCSSSGCTASSGSGNYIQNGMSLQTSANFNIDGSGSFGGTITVSGSGNSTFVGNVGVATTTPAYNLTVVGIADFQNGEGVVGNSKIITQTTPGQYSFVVPADTTSITVDAAGAQGGNGSSGEGARVQTVIPVTPGTTIYYTVGGSNGYNGGGSGDTNGGGATDIRINGTSLSDRVIVAGGGGGSSTQTSYNTGGNAGQNGSNGAGVLAGTGGTQTSGGSGGGSLGQGGNGSGTSGWVGGGGGGGYYGGGAATGNNNYGASGGGGGSSYSIVAATYTTGYEAGNGYITISYTGSATAALFEGQVGINTSNPQQGLNIGSGYNTATNMATPGTLTLANANTGGSLSSGTYYYEVTALDGAGGETSPSSEQSIVVPSGTSTNEVTVSWSAVPGAASYRVYRGTSSGGENTYYTTATNSLIDTGSVGTTATPPGSTSTNAYVTYFNTAGNSYILGGNLGIGTSTPSAKLQVAGSTLIAPTTNSGTTLVVQNVGGSAILSVDTSNQRVDIGSVGTPTGQLYVSGTVPTTALGNVSTQSGPSDLYVQGSYAYVVNENSNSLQVFDVSNPSSPANVATVTTSSGPRSVVIQGDYAYVGTSGGVIQIFNIINPTSPTLESSISVTGGYGGLGYYSLAVSGRYAYAVFGTAIESFNISNPSYPVAIDTAVGTENGGSDTAIFIKGNYAYVGGAGSGYFNSYNISNPYSLIRVGSNQPGGYDNGDVYVQGNYAYVTTNYASGGLGIMDLSNPGSPYQVGWASISTTSPYDTDDNVYVQGSYAYVSTGAGSVYVYNVADPTNPTLVGTITTASGNTTSVFVSGRYLYVTNTGTPSLQVFNIGGAYIQQLQTGGLETSNLQVDGNSNLGGDESIEGGLTIGSSLQVNGDVGLSGQLSLQNLSNSTSAFDVQNASGSQLLVVDTTDNQVSIESNVLNLSNNIRGVNVAVTNSASSLSVTFNTAYPDANYAVLCTPGFDSDCYVTGKTDSGFTLNFDPVAPSSGSNTVDWLVVH